MSIDVKTIGIPKLEIYNFNITTTTKENFVFDSVIKAIISWKIKGYIQYEYKSPEDESIINADFLSPSTLEDSDKAKIENENKAKQFFLTFISNKLYQAGSEKIKLIYEDETIYDENGKIKKECYDENGNLIYDIIEKWAIRYKVNKEDGISLYNNTILLNELPSDNIDNTIQFIGEFSFVKTIDQKNDSPFETEFGLLSTLKDKIYYVNSSGISGIYSPIYTTVSKKTERTLELEKNKILTYVPIECGMGDGWYNNNSSGINLNNNDIVKVNGIFFNEDQINNIGEGIHFYHPNANPNLSNFDIFYGRNGKLYFMSNPNQSDLLKYNEKFKLCYGPGDTFTISSRTPLSGYISDSKRLIQFLIPLTIPILNYNGIEITGTISVRGNNGYVSHFLRTGKINADTDLSTKFDDITTRFELGQGDDKGLVTHENINGTQLPGDWNNNIETTVLDGNFYNCGIPKNRVGVTVTPSGLSISLSMLGDEDYRFSNVTNNTPISIVPMKTIYAYYNYDKIPENNIIPEDLSTKFQIDPYVPNLKITIT